MMHRSEDYLLEDCSESLINFVKNGPTWKSSEEMQNSMTLQEKGWNVKVLWKEERINGKEVGLGAFANQFISKGTTLRTCIFGKNLFIFNNTTNLPNVDNKEIVEYLKHYNGVCPCNVASHADNMSFYFPAACMNHSSNPSVHYRCWADRCDIVAARDIQKGDSITVDYRNEGNPPSWYIKLLEEKLGSNECVFVGFNDYVQKKE